MNRQSVIRESKTQRRRRDHLRRLAIGRCGRIPARTAIAAVSIFLDLRLGLKSSKILSLRTLLTLRVGPLQLARGILVSITPHPPRSPRPSRGQRPCGLQPLARNMAEDLPLIGSGRAGSPRTSNGAEPCRRDRACRTSGKQGARPLPGPAFYSIKASGSRRLFGRPASPPGPMLSS